MAVLKRIDKNTNQWEQIEQVVCMFIIKMKKEVKK